MPFASSGSEVGRLIDFYGKSNLDFAASWALAELGYSNDRIRSDVAAGLERAIFGRPVSGINRRAVELAERLISFVPGDWEQNVWYGLSGSEAIEAAMGLPRGTLVAVASSRSSGVGTKTMTGGEEAVRSFSI